jgi:hypothetical protein
MIEITRRSLLRTGATATAAALVGVRPWNVTAAAAATPVGPLRRSDYAGLAGTDFAVVDGTGPERLRLASIADVQGAVHQQALRGSEDAFALSFSGDARLESGIHTLEHAQLGRFELFVSPVGADAEHAYEVVVDRSVGAPPSPPPAPPQRLDAGRAETTGAAAAALAPAAAPTGDAPASSPRRTVAPSGTAKVLRAATVRRLGRGARVDLTLLAAAKAQTVRVRLERGGKTVAHATHAVHDRRASIVLRTSRHLPAATYTLTVTAVEAGGATVTQRRRITVR